MAVTCKKCGKVNENKNAYCIECGYQLEGTTSVEFQIIENLKVDLYGSIACLAVFVAFMVLVTVAIISEYGAFGFISIPIIWPLTIGGLIWASCYMKGLSINRRFTITKDSIEVLVPHKPEFRINWSEFDAIEVTKRESMTAVPTPDLLILGPKFVYFTLVFRGQNAMRSYEFESGKDFKVRSRKKILFALEKSAKDRGKGFTGYRWKDKRSAKNASKT